MEAITGYPSHSFHTASKALSSRLCASVFIGSRRCRDSQHSNHTAPSLQQDVNAVAHSTASLVGFTMLSHGDHMQPYKSSSGYIFKNASITSTLAGLGV